MILMGHPIGEFHLGQSIEVPLINLTKDNKIKLKTLFVNEETLP